MPRYRLNIEYDGSSLVGWQRQINGPSVQGLIEQAAQRFCGDAVDVVGAGRTDSGVHALCQVAHLDFQRPYRTEEVMGGLNFWLRVETGQSPVAITAASLVSDDFHARFSAIGRRYRYRIVNRTAPLALDIGRAWWVRRRLDSDIMHQAAQSLVGRHDFSTFRATACQSASPVKTLDRLEVVRTGDEIEIFAAARSFLHHQVRNMVGSLKLVGQGRWKIADLERALAARDRRQGGPTAPAGGLYLTEVIY